MLFKTHFISKIVYVVLPYMMIQTATYRTLTSLNISTWHTIINT